MFSQVKFNLWTTKVFFIVRLSAAVLVSFVYILLAAAVQDYYVRIFGESTFNYIVGGILSLAIGSWVCTYFGSLLFMFVRGWHVAALARAKDIQKRNLSALDAGMMVFRKHMTSFAAVYGSSLIITKFALRGTDKVWDMLEDVPYLGSLAKVADFPLVKHLARDLLDTCYDAVIFYLVRYTKPGLGDDMQVLPTALRKYLYSLPTIIGGSLSAYLLLYVLPAVLRVFCVASAFISQGIVGGILLTVLMFPIFYILKHVVFDPMETIILISAFSKHVNDEEPADGPFKKAVDAVLDELGFDAGEDASQSEDELAESKPRQKKEQVEDEPDGDEAEGYDEDITAMLGTIGTLYNPEEAGEVSVTDLPLADEEPQPQPTSGREKLSALAGAYTATKDDVISNVPTSNLNSLLGPPPGDDETEEDEDEDEVPPVAKLSAILGGIDPATLNETLSPGGDNDDDGSSGDIDSFGGGDIEFM